jgi:diketogulonate reductase-like aldo/keto reductase
MATVAVAWTLSKGVCPIVGFSKKERVDEAIKAVSFKLTEEESTYLEEAYKPHQVVGLVVSAAQTPSKATK